VSVDVTVARSLREALEALARPGAPTQVLAGGTDLMVELRTGRARPERVVDVWKLGELRGVRAEADGLRIGALATCAELRQDPLVARGAALVAAACAEVGAEQIQARATLGGNLGTASPAADLNPALVALGARVRLVSLAGARELSCDEFLAGYRRTLRRPDELVESVLVPTRPAGERCGLRKVGTRRAQSISKLVVALALSVEGRRITALRAAAGSVGPRTLRLAGLERALVGAALEPQLLRAAALRSAREDIAPIDDVRSSEAYRRQVFARVLATLLGELSGAFACPS
jgi:CO/xanthine dehydrogenase FAD-binding subunit